MKLSPTYLKHTQATAWPRCAGMCLGAGGDILSTNVQETEVQRSFARIASEDRNQNLNKEAGR